MATDRSPGQSKPRLQKMALIGDGGVGKTSLLIVRSKGGFPTVFLPSLLGTTLIDDQKDARLELWDTIGRSEDGGFVPLSDGDTDLVLICFSVDNPDSLDNALERWVSDVAHYCPGTPYILVGCKLDLRSDPKTYSDLARLDQRPVTEEEGKKMAHKIGAMEYVECSALTGEGVQLVFEQASKAALRYQIKRGRERRPRTVL